MKKSLVLAIVAALFMIPAGAAQAQQPAPTLREISVSSPIASVQTDGIFMLYLSQTQGGADLSLYAANIVGGDPILLETGLAIDSPFSIDGGIAVWAVQKPDGVHISARDLRSGASFAISTSPKLAGAPKIQGGRVVWGELRDDGAHVLTRTFTSGQVTELDSGARLLNGPIIWGDYAAWAIDRGDVRQIIRRNIRSMDAPQVITSLEFTAPSIFMLSNTHLGWTDFPPLGPSSSGQPLANKTYIHDLRSGQTRSFEEQFGPGITLAGSPAVGAASVVLEQYASSIAVVNLQTGKRTDIPTTHGISSYTDRHILSSEPRDGAIDLYGYDIQAQTRFSIAADDRENVMPSLGSGMLVYQHGLTSPITIRAVQIARAMPAEQSVYFPQTGHTLSGTFRSFWERSGGLATFGYPLTEEYAERNADTGQVYTVQIFERQRFELHPENAGGPYEVLIGRMGAADAQRRNLTANVAFLPIDHPDETGCLWFPETGHSICGSQLRYWRRAGVDLDDPGISQRESLALYGLPLSQPFVDPQLARTVQIFERARFEEFPENPEPYTIQFGRLGAESAGL
ncbi:hypothetical protein F8S13_01980 [Chloroflexia bacterium SDU3-3]|nr:hypothetical protein F8S13_01980 [Chloroflexia bacterium SDU3-3]